VNKTNKKYLERVRTKVSKAINDYALISDGDTIVVGVSGGKDSMALLDMLSNRQKSSKIHYNIIAVHIQLTDVPYHTNDAYLQSFCEARGIDFQLITDDAKIIIEGKQPCFYCAWNRRRLLFQFAAKNKYQKIALGHHRDDAVETLLMNMMQHGEMSSFPVKLSMFDGAFEIIRPLIYNSNKELERYINIIGYQPLPYDCEYAQSNQREDIKQLIKQFYSITPNASKNIFKAMTNIDLKHLPIKKKS
jgi:tRNA(Ile)-lysidine synthase TilS/MesJ